MRTLAIVVIALALPLAAQELPSAPSATKQQAEAQAFRAQMDAPPNVTDRLNAGDQFQVSAVSPSSFRATAAAAGIIAPANGLQQHKTVAANRPTGSFVGKVLSPLMGRQDAQSGGNGQRTLGARLMGALSQMADIDDDPNPAPANYSQFLGMGVSDTIANAYYPLDGHGMRHSGGGFGAHVGANSGLVRGFLPGVKQFLLGRKMPAQQRDALTWRTGAAAQAPVSVH